MNKKSIYQTAVFSVSFEGLCFLSLLPTGIQFYYQSGTLVVLRHQDLFEKSFEPGTLVTSALHLDKMKAEYEKTKNLFNEINRAWNCFKSND